MHSTQKMAKPKQMTFDEATLALNADGKAEKVKRRNFTYLFRAYATIHGKPGEVGRNINPIDHASQWGAWRAYRREKKIPCGFMDLHGQRLANMHKDQREDVCGYLVPCDWPADFDADWDAAADKYAGDRFVNAQERKRQEVAAMADIDKAAVVQGSLTKHRRV